jgi:hypothetical protein
MELSNIPKSVIDELMNDQDFLSLNDQDQDEIMASIEKKYNHRPNAMNMLQKASNIIKQNVSDAMLPPKPMDPSNPFGSAIQGTFSGLKKVPGLGPYMTGHDIKSDIAQEASPGAGGMLLDMVSDPEALLGPKVVQSGAKAISKKFPYRSAESRVDFTKNVEKKLLNRRRALGKSYGKSLEKSWGQVDLRDIEIELGLPEPKGIYTMKEAQDLRNSLSTIIPENIKSGKKISPKYLDERTLSKEIGDRMRKADPSMTPVMEKFGKHAENFKEAISPIQSSRGPENVFGGNILQQMSGAGGKLGDRASVALKRFAPRISKEVEKAKFNEDTYRKIKGAVVIGGLSAAASPFIPGFIKRALYSKASS